MVKKLILFCLLGAALCSCNAGKVHVQLRDIEGYISERPDSALAALRAMDTLRLGNKATRAKYSLLHAMALDKNYIDTTDLRVIAPAKDYYESHGKADDQMKAYFYLGRIYQNAKDYYSAMNAFTTAYDYSAKSEDNNFKCLICSQLSSMYSYNGNAVRELFYSQKAKAYADLAENELSSWIMQGRVATGYANNKQWEKSDSLFSVFLNRPILDTNYYATFKLWASQVAIKKNPIDANKCIRLYNEAIALGRRPTVVNLMVVAYAYEILGQSNEADRITSAVDAFVGNNKNGSVEVWKYRINKHRRNYEIALAEFECGIQAQDSILVAVLEASFDKVQKDYYNEKANRIAAEKSKQTIVTGIIIVAIIIVCAILLFLYLRKQRLWIQQMEDAESLRNDFARLLSEDTDKEYALGKLRSQYRNVFREQFRILDELCAAYWSPKKGNKKELIYSASSKTIELIKNDDKLEEKIDQHLDGIMTKLRADFPKKKDSDFKLIALFIIGFSGKTIASIMNLSVGTVYTYKNRIKQEITGLDAPNKDLYLEFFG